jgi:hypothetical protein
MAQVVEHISGKHKALSSNPVPQKQKGEANLPIFFLRSYSKYRGKVLFVVTHMFPHPQNIPTQMSVHVS